jgi:hypothetical protein
MDIPHSDIGPLRRGYDPQLLRTWALLWDKVAMPVAGNPDDLPLEQDFAYLKGIGILEEYRLSEDSNFLSEVGRSRSGYCEVMVPFLYRKLSDAEPGRWSIGQGDSKGGEEQATDGRGFYVDLVRAIPVPDSEVPLDDVLRFRERHQSELLAMRHYLDRLYQEVLGAHDRPLAELTVLEGLSAAIADQIAASRSSGLGFRLLDLRAQFNLASASVAMISALSNQYEVALAALASGFTIHVGRSLSFKAPQQGATPLRYVARYHQELFCGR